MLPVRFDPPAAKYIKKLKDKKLKKLYQEAIDKIREDYTIGETKTGDLIGFYDLYQSLLLKFQTKTSSEEDNWRLYPAFVNLSFSCEIILKLFYENDHGKIARGHKLYKELYNKLSANSKKIISDITVNAMKNNYDLAYTNETFINDLKKSENTFAHERYSFEMIPGISYSLQCAFLATFSRMLNILVKGLS